MLFNADNYCYGIINLWFNKSCYLNLFINAIKALLEIRPLTG